MHAFLLIGNSTEYLVQRAEELAKKLNAKILEFPLTKIEDVRNLNNLIRLSFDEPTLIVSENIHEATEEALNAFLKNLEEPQENIYFALTAPSARKVLPTIVSRCEIIKVNSEELIVNSDEAVKFLKADIGERLAQIDKIKDRSFAIKFVEDLIDFTHSLVHTGTENYSDLAKNLEAETQTLINLRANGNVGLQLTNMVVSLI
ncbi:MAG: hypothetical protein NT162_03820 [Candidatus Woesebacteria bacterium]|nr:hypothetical protein [Candidatus Woesebacteria bacterium]